MSTPLSGLTKFKSKGIAMDAINQQDVEMLAEANKWIDWKNSLERLERNSDFQKVFLNGYMKDRAVEAVSLLARGDIKAQGKRPDIMEYLVGISQFQDFMQTITAMGQSAEQDLEMAEDEAENEG